MRENYNNNGIIREYKNGNITIKYYQDGIKASKEDNIYTLWSVMELLDCAFIGDTYCLSNYETGYTIYNYHNDKVYIFPWSDLETLENGKTIRLYARKPDETDRELIEREG